MRNVQSSRLSEINLADIAAELALRRLDYNIAALGAVAARACKIPLFHHATVLNEGANVFLRLKQLDLNSEQT